MNYNANVSGWSLENGYNNSINNKRYPKQDYPIRVFNVKESSTFIVSIRMHEKDFEYSCRSMIPGVKIFLHTPGDTLPSGRHSFRIPLSEEVQISIQAKLTTTSEKLRTYTPDQRQCFFNSERKLSFFKTYTQRNCELECLSNYTELSCGCVRFSMPSKFKFFNYRFSIVRPGIFRVERPEEMDGRMSLGGRISPPAFLRGPFVNFFRSFNSKFESQTYVRYPIFF